MMNEITAEEEGVISEICVTNGQVVENTEQNCSVSRGKAMNREEIMNILPHRDNMLLLDDVENKNGTAVGHYTVRGDEFFLKGHFLIIPIVPGVILCEILAQSACVLMQDAMSEGKLPVYTGLNNVKFRSPVKPGDTVETRCRIKRAKHPFYFAEGIQLRWTDGYAYRQNFPFAITGA